MENCLNLPIYTLDDDTSARQCATHYRSAHIKKQVQKALEQGRSCANDGCGATQTSNWHPIDPKDGTVDWQCEKCYKKISEKARLQQAQEEGRVCAVVSCGTKETFKWHPIKPENGDPAWRCEKCYRASLKEKQTINKRARDYSPAALGSDEPAEIKAAKLVPFCAECKTLQSPSWQILEEGIGLLCEGCHVQHLEAVAESFLGQ
jgi:hypothetical protein